MFCIPDQAKRSRIEVVRHGMIFQHPVVAPLGSPGVPLQQLMPTAQGRSADVFSSSHGPPGPTTLMCIGVEGERETDAAGGQRSTQRVLSDDTSPSL